MFSASGRWAPSVHHRVIAATQRLQDQSLVVRMVLVDEHRHAGSFGQGMEQVRQDIQPTIVEIPKVTLQHDRGVFRLCGNNDGTCGFEIADIKRRNGKAILQRVGKEQTRLGYFHQVR